MLLLGILEPFSAALAGFLYCTQYFCMLFWIRFLGLHWPQPQPLMKVLSGIKWLSAVSRCNAQERRRPSLKNLRRTVEQLAKTGQAGPAFFTAAHEGTGLSKLRQELDGKVSLLISASLSSAGAMVRPGQAACILHGGT